MTIHQMTEAKLLDSVVKRCQEWGLFWYHSYDRRRVKMAGWPDLVVVGHGVLYREIKSAAGTLSVDQAAWSRALLACGENSAVWRPDDLESGRVDRELRQLTLCGLPGRPDDDLPAGQVVRPLAALG